MTTNAAAIKFTKDGGDLFIPDGKSVDAALARTTHLGIGAHQDDVEFMAMHGIGECYQDVDQWFGGIVCTNGAGSARQGEFATVTDEEMQQIRAEEQRTAARFGEYSFVAQLAHASAEIKQPDGSELEDELFIILQQTQPGTVYTHNLADKHATHIAVTAAFIKAARRLPVDQRPRRVIGCEVWRDLDWLPDDRKVMMDLSDCQELAEKLRGVFVSQIAGGKRYDLAVAGRNRAHATFANSHATDAYESLSIGMDLTPLMLDDALLPEAYISGLIEEFEQGVLSELGRYF